MDAELSGVGSTGGAAPRAPTLHRRTGFCGSTVFSLRSMQLFMVFAFPFLLLWGLSPTLGGSAALARRNPRLLRRAGTLFTLIASHTV